MPAPASSSRRAASPALVCLLSASGVPAMAANDNSGWTSYSRTGGTDDEERRR